MASKAQLAQDADRLQPDCLHAFDDRAGVRLGVGEGTLQVVHHWQPHPRDPRHGVRLRPGDLAGAPLARVVCVGKSAQPLVLKLSNPVGEFSFGAGACVGAAV
jgi:hypothetical protein